MAKNTVFCDECKKQIDTRIKDFSFYSKILCSECTDKFDWNKRIDYYIFSEKNFKPEDRHLFVISFCSNCNKPKIMRKDKIIKGLEKYGYHLCDACNRSRQAKENLKELNGENRYKIHSTKACKDARRKQALSNLEKINSEEGLQSRKDNGVFERAHKTRLGNGFYDKFGVGYRFCEKCGKETLHNGMVCKICHPEVIPGNPKCGELFKEKWKNSDYRKNMLKILKERWKSNPILKLLYSRDENGNITHVDGVPIEEKYQIIKNRHWVLPSGEITSNQQRAISHNGEPVEGPRGYLYDDNGNITHIDEIPIEEKYKAIITTNILDIKNSLFISTGRDQNSNSWEGKEAFDQFLVSQSIGWFVYVKFDELGNPLVVGKTGTKAVSNSINDIIFDYWENNKGPARQYLKDNNLDWDKTKVLIVPCKTEQDALDKEKEIQEKYNLFGS